MGKEGNSSSNWIFLILQDGNVHFGEDVAAAYRDIVENSIIYVRENILQRVFSSSLS